MSFDFNFFEMLLEPVLVLDKSGRILYLNPSATNLFEISSKKSRHSQNLLKVVTFNPPLEELKSLEAIKGPTPYKEISYSTTSKKQGRAQICITPVSLGSESHWIIYFRDVTLEENLHRKYKRELKQREIYTEIIEQAHQDLARYSENLEKMVDERTLELQKLNTTLHALLDSLDQGFFIFNSDGECMSVYSKSCESLLDLLPNNNSFVDVINIERKDQDTVASWIRSLFAVPGSFKELAPMGPKYVANHKNRILALNYYPIINDHQQLDGVVAVVTDKTDLEKAEMEAERERAYSLMVINVIRRKREIIKFIFDTQKLLTDLETLISDHYRFNIQLALRSLHTIKGGATTFAIYDLAVSCHLAEKYLVMIQSEGLAKDSLQILQSQFSKIKYEFQSFLKSNQMLLGNEVIHGKRTIEIPQETIVHFLDTLRSHSELKDNILQFEKNIFYVPIRQFLEGLEETAQALASKLGKKLKPILIEGGDILIHRERYSEVFSTLIHQLNNIVDHGIEDPVLRRFHHKEEMGQITIRIRTQKTSEWGESEALVIEISDDGQGLDPVKIREQAQKRGLPTAHLTDEEILQYIFKSNITTTDNLTQISGRGIGMEAIMFAVTELKGHLHVSSIPLKGMTLTMTLPYSLEPVRLVA